MTERKKGPRSEQEILRATIDLIDLNGYTDLTIEAIAARASVGKTTIYRWWTSKEELVLDAYLMQMEIQFDFNAKEPLQQGFLNNMKKLTYVLNSNLGRAVAMIVTEDDDIADKFYTEYLKPRRTQSKDILSLAVERGDIKSSVDLDMMLDMLYGPIYFRIFIFKDMPDAAYIKA